MERFADPIVLAVIALAFAIGFAVRGDGRRTRDEPRPPARVGRKTAKATSTPPARLSRAAGLERLTAQDWIAIDEELYNGRKINAIKLLRAAAGFGLKDAKDEVEARARDLGVR